MAQLLPPTPKSRTLCRLMLEAPKRGARRLANGPMQEKKYKEKTMKLLNNAKITTGFILLIVIFSAAARAQTTAFTYQGKLNDGATAANGNYLLEFKLFDTSATGTGQQIGPTVSDVAATLANGIFTVQLDFGPNAFDGANRFIEISVRRNAGESYTTLTPRQLLTSAPYAIKAKTAETAVSATNATNAANAVNATNADTLDGIDSTGFVASNTTLFVRNQTTQQAADFNVSGKGTANILNATTQFNLNDSRVLSAPGAGNLFTGVFAGDDNTTGSNNSFFGTYSGFRNTTGGGNSFFGTLSGNRVTTGNDNSFVGAFAGNNSSTGARNSFFGVAAGNSNLTGSDNTMLGYSAEVGADNLIFATAIGSNSRVSTSNTIALGRTNGADTVLAYGRIQVNTLGAAGATTLCRNASNQIATCSSSLRYKTNINPFNSGLSIINRLRPITFDWKDGGMSDLGLGAEEVAAVDENLVIRNENGEVEGVKYDRLGVVLINAVREQQAQIEEQKKQIEAQSKQIELLKQFVCAQNPKTEVCR